MRLNRWIVLLCVGMSAAVTTALIGCVHPQVAMKHHAAKKSPPNEDEAHRQIATLQAQVDALKSQTIVTSIPPAQQEELVQTAQQLAAAEQRATQLSEELAVAQAQAQADAARAANAGSASASNSGEPTGRQLNGWYKGLSNGLVEYSVPGQMYVGESVTVTVRVHGSSSKTPTLGGRTGTAMAKVSTQMQAQLGQSANPGEFDIDPVGPVQKTVLDEADNTWTWTVKPLKRVPAPGAQLDIQLWVLYPGQEAKDQVPIVSTSIPVVVAIPPPAKIIHDIVPQDPQTIAQQLFPKGIWAAIGAALLWLGRWVMKRFGKEGGAAPAPQHEEPEP